MFNLIRGSNPQPGGMTSYGHRNLKIFDSHLRSGDSKRAPGEIIKVADSGFLVMATGGAIFIKRVQPKDSPKIAAADFIAQSGLKPGDNLGE